MRITIHFLLPVSAEVQNCISNFAKVYHLEQDIMHVFTIPKFLSLFIRIRQCETMEECKHLDKGFLTFDAILHPFTCNLIYNECLQLEDTVYF